MRRSGFYVLLILVGIYCLGPFLWQFITSIKPEAELTTLPPLLPQSPTLKHYISIFDGHPFFRIIVNSFIVAALTTALSLIIGSLAAFALAKLEIKWKGLILAFVLAVSMFPPIVTVSPLYIIIRALKMRDTLPALVITYTTFSLPLTIWVLNSFFRKIPHEIYLASRVDGCTVFESFYKIILPLSAPGLFSTAILVFIFSWNEFLFALTFTSTSASRTIPVEIALFPGLHEVPWGEISAASVIVTIPIVILTFAFQRRIVEGLTAGATKG
jgi:multiple sugar transport system permease protein